MEKKILIEVNKMQKRYNERAARLVLAHFGGRVIKEPPEEIKQLRTKPPEITQPIILKQPEVKIPVEIIKPEIKIELKPDVKKPESLKVTGEAIVKKPRKKPVKSKSNK